MSEDNNILFSNEEKGKQKQLSDDRLMAYLAGTLSAADQHEVELWLADEGMESDALEGLIALQPGEATDSVARINHNLHKKLGNKKRTRRDMQSNQFTWVAIIIILLLVVVAYIVIRKVM